MKPLYFDYNATTPVHDRVLQAMLPSFKEAYGNPGCLHPWGLAARETVERARGRLAAFVGAGPEEIVFTSGATESDNWALLGLFPDFKGHVVISAVEHPAVFEPARWLADQGVTLTVVPVDSQGLVDPADVRRACRADSRLVSIMLANNEVGTIQPLAEIAAWCRERNILVHTDAAQAVGKIPVRVDELRVDLMSVAGHKMYAPKGVGALYIRSGIRLNPIFRGGGQEHGLRPGTENVAFMAALGQAAALADEDLEAEANRQRDLGQQFLEGLGRCPRPFVLHSNEAPRLPGTMSVAFPGLRAGDILSGLLAREVAVSAGAACHSGQVRMSRVLEAMGVAPDTGQGTIRFSWGRMINARDVDELLDRLGETLAELGPT
ncbi:MAG: cysteine desulfurase [Deltaproteobacteria bacterium]|nr:cysteine desulfurase [Deltaproteobacteria bacterium]